MENAGNKKPVKWTRSGRGFRVDIEASGDDVRLELHGEVDLYTQPVLRSAIDGALELGLPSLTLDFTDVFHLDSGGMAMLISATKKLNSRGGHLRLVSVNSHIYRTLVMTGLVEFLDASPAEQAA